MGYDVFISYSSHDKLISDAVCATLESHGIRCWIAPRDIVAGVDWSDAIIDAITECQIFVLVLSEASNKSEQVKREVQNAVSEGKPILPFRIEEVALSKHMRYFIGTPHWLDAMTPPMERHLQRMAQTVGSLMSTIDEKGIDLITETLRTMPPEPEASAPTFAWDMALVSKIEAEFCHFVGPLGPVLMREATALATSYSDLCQRLANQIQQNSDRQRFLQRSNAILTGVASVAPVSVAKPVVAPVAAPVPPAFTLNEQTLSTAEKAFAEFMGPLARMLVKRAARDAQSREDFHHRLAEQLATTTEKTKFLKKVSG